MVGSVTESCCRVESPDRERRNAHDAVRLARGPWVLTDL